MIIGKSLTAIGGGGLKPEIRVTAKAGALLNLHYKDSSIILQSYQLEANETQHTFVVNVSDTAYVIDDSTNNASVEVLVDAVAVFEAEIEYVLWLYKDGDECNNITGGFNCYIGSGSGSASSVKNDANITITSTVCYGNYGRTGKAAVVNQIDLTNYSKLRILADTTTNISTSAPFVCCLIDGYEKTVSIAEFKSGDIIIPIDSYNGTHSIEFAFYGLLSGTTITATTIMTKVWLE